MDEISKPHFALKKRQWLTLGLIKGERVWLIAIAMISLIGLYYGWKIFWFLTDDAFISFRYVSNSVLGFGYVWNPPPFKPVEGYTSFLWVVLLDVVWRASNIDPPTSANYISLLFSSFTLLLGFRMSLQQVWIGDHKKYRLWYLFLFILGILTNRTFLAWTSSGLETAMFNFFLLYWIFATCYHKHSSAQWMWSVSLSSALLALTRPDGLLFVAASVLLIGVVAINKSEWTKVSPKDWLKIAPFGLPIMHLIWRKWTYGEWLPNTYYAKSAPDLFWIKSGTYYLLTFIIEYSLWIFLGFLIVFLIQKGLNGRISYSNLLSRLREDNSIFIKIFVLLTLFTQIGYYTFVIGGDYFEFRVYSYLIFLIFLASIWLLTRMVVKPWLALTVFFFFIAATWPIPWSHWYLTRNINERSEIHPISVADAVQQNALFMPGFALSYLRLYDDLLLWLNDHYICIRYHEHKVLWLHLTEYYPSRDDGSLISNDGYPVTKQNAVGILAWVLPHVNIIDMLGLNDYVVARNSDLDPGMHMAHLHRPPDGYADCFDSNIKIRKNAVSVRSRLEPLTAEKIIFCESHFLDVVKGSNNK